MQVENLNDEEKAKIISLLYAAKIMCPAFWDYNIISEESGIEYKKDALAKLRVSIDVTKGLVEEENLQYPEKIKIYIKKIDTETYILEQSLDLAEVIQAKKNLKKDIRSLKKEVEYISTQMDFKINPPKIITPLPKKSVGRTKKIIIWIIKKILKQK